MFKKGENNNNNNTFTVWYHWCLFYFVQLLNMQFTQNISSFHHIIGLHNILLTTHQITLQTICLQKDKSDIRRGNLSSTQSTWCSSLFCDLISLLPLGITSLRTSNTINIWIASHWWYLLFENLNGWIIAY